jgi:hypothetical protein
LGNDTGIAPADVVQLRHGRRGVLAVITKSLRVIGGGPCGERQQALGKVGVCSFDLDAGHCRSKGSVRVSVGGGKLGPYDVELEGEKA